ncbi:PKD domain-containing protein [Massilia sp. TWP1-3-3]|uniref:PKD domain-containing protein n=1 Tax=Massilia sp. TWP1-3-3 TaxID=2804573 RepID=UPI003CF87F27
MKYFRMSAFGRLASGAALAMAVLSGCGGDSAPAPAARPAANAAPAPTVLLSGVFESSAVIGADVSAIAGSNINLNGLTSTDPDGDALSYRWSISAKPAGSTLVLASSSAGARNVKPDVAGSYVFDLRVTDARGAYATKSARIQIKPNAPPVANIVVTASYTGASTTKPAQVLNVGAAVVLDAGGSTDADGDVVTTTWTMLEKPAASSAALTVAGATGRFVLDAPGQYKVAAHGADPKGAYSDTIYVFQASNRAPQTVVLASVSNEPGASGASTLSAATGYTVSLDGATSADPEGTSLSYAWSMVSKPAGSLATVSAASGAISQVTPDVLGEYVVKLIATDKAGAASTYTTTISVKNQRPSAAITGTATPLALPTGPTMRLPLKTLTTLRGTASVDADGDALSYAWSMASQPSASTAVLSSGSTPTVEITPDVSGSYVVLLRVTDPSGAFSEQTVTLEVGNYAPVAVIDKSRMTVLTGAPARASAALSYDENGDSLSYAWAIDARPAGSAAAIAAPAAAALSFTPDLPGTYVASVTVSDGKSSSIAYVQLRALAGIASAVTLDFVPDIVRQSKGLDKLVMTEKGGKSLRIIDPYTGVKTSVVLPAMAKAMQVSADGKLAAVLYEGALSLVNLETAAIVQTFATSGSQTDAFVTNAGRVYLIGQTGGQWVDPELWGFNGYTGANLNIDVPYGNGTFYGTQYGTFSETRQRGYLLSQGLSPAKVTYFDVDGASGKLIKAGDSPYHGTYAMSTPLFLSDDSSILFTSGGNYFRADTLLYAGKLSVTGGIVSMSHSVAAQEALVVVSSALGYEPSYKRFTGALLFPDSDLALPLINSEQSYGLQVFHGASGGHVAVVQTGSRAQNAVSAKYFVIAR